MSFRDVLNQPLPSKQHTEILFEEDIVLDTYFKEDSVGREISLGHAVKNAKIHVYGNEGKRIPHFHITAQNGRFRKKAGFECCVCIDIPNYFIHPGKEDTLTNDEIRDLIPLLKRKQKKYGGLTLYKVICQMWNKGKTNEFKVDETADIPDYLELNNPSNKPKTENDKR